MNYRLVFPDDVVGAVKAGTAHITSDRRYEVGDVITHHGRRWRVTQAPLNERSDGSVSDLLVWPAED